jgi:lipopolysaccharide export system protein LptA
LKPDRKMNNRIVLNILLLLSSMCLFGESYSFSSDYLKSVMAEGKEVTLLDGNVLITSESKRISAETVQLIGEDFNVFLCEGAVEVEDLDNDFLLTSETFHYDNDRKIMRINDFSVMEDRKNELVIKSGYMENREEEDLIILQIGVRILKEDLSCRSEFAVYHRDTNTLELTGLPVVYRNEDVFRASRITVNLDTDEIKMEGEVQGSLLSEDESDSEEEASLAAEDEETVEQE